MEVYRDCARAYCLFVRFVVILRGVLYGVRCFSLISRDRLEDVLGNLQAFTGLAIQLIDNGGGVLLSFGQAPDCCATLEREVFRRGECAPC